MAMMNLSSFEYLPKVRIYFKDGDVLEGKTQDYTISEDNDDQGAYLIIVPSRGSLEGKFVQCLENEISKVVILK